MADFSSGVSGYVTGRYEIKVNFPIDLKGRPRCFLQSVSLLWQKRKNMLFK